MRSLVQNDWKEAGEKLRSYRKGDEETYVNDACFRCSWCFANMSQVVNKLESYPHSIHNQEKYKDPKWILEKYRDGLDLFERGWDQFDYVENNRDVPQYVLEHEDQYGFMLSRRGKPNAGFIDVELLSLAVD
ncbi:hypothetical protein BGX27_001840 [Mortierella sp. AM989]|nr:hypothetical protein BGX27_001840 [Mortierella sp. AM989]